MLLLLLLVAAIFIIKIKSWNRSSNEDLISFNMLNYACVTCTNVLRVLYTIFTIPTCLPTKHISRSLPALCTLGAACIVFAMVLYLIIYVPYLPSCLMYFIQSASDVLVINLFYFEKIASRLESGSIK